MKILQRILLIFIIAACVFMVMPQNTVKADVDIDSTIGDVDPTSPESDTDGIMGVVNKIIGFIQWASVIALVLVLIAKGWQYITSENAKLKEEVKNSAVPILVGTILVFGATTIAKFVLNTAKI